MHRRRLLGCVAGGAVLAGCLDFGEEGQQFCLYAEPTSTDEAVARLAPPISELEGEAARIAEEAVREGAALAYRSRARELPLADPTYVRADGGYYRLTFEQTGNAEVERWVLRAESADDPVGEAVPIGELDGDRHRYVQFAVEMAYRVEENLERVYTPEDDEMLEPREPERLVVMRNDPEGLSLAPEPDPEFVSHEEFGTFRLEASKETVEEREFTYGSTLVAETDEEFLDERVADLDEPPLSEEERTIFEEAIEESHYTEGWSEGHPISEAFSEPFLDLVDRIEAAAEPQTLTELDDVTHYARFDGKYYRVELALRDHRYDPGEC